MSEIIDILGGKSSGGAQAPSDDMNGAIGALSGQKKTFHIGKYENYKCSCGCQLFTTAVVIKKVPAIDLGEILNEDVPVPVEQVPVWVCTKCGELAPFIKNDEDSMRTINKLLKLDAEKNEKEELIQEA